MEWLLQAAAAGAPSSSPPPPAAVALAVRDVPACLLSSRRSNAERLHGLRARAGVRSSGSSSTVSRHWAQWLTARAQEFRLVPAVRVTQRLSPLSACDAPVSTVLPLSPPLPYGMQQRLFPGGWSGGMCRAKRGARKRPQALPARRRAALLLPCSCRFCPSVPRRAAGKESWASALVHPASRSSPSLLPFHPESPLHMRCGNAMLAKRCLLHFFALICKVGSKNSGGGGVHFFQNRWARTVNES